MTRFWIEPEQTTSQSSVLTGENAAHAKVLRLKAGEHVLVCDGEGNECECTVSDISQDRISLVVNSRQESVSEAKVKAVFEFRCSCLAGYSPDLFSCRVCGNRTPEYFDISGGRSACSGCRSYDFPGIRMPVTSGMLDALRYISACDCKRLFSFDLPEDTLELLASVTESYLSAQLERGFSALDFYKSLIFVPQ